MKVTLYFCLLLLRLFLFDFSLSSFFLYFLFLFVLFRVREFEVLRGNKQFKCKILERQSTAALNSDGKRRLDVGGMPVTE